MDFVCDLLARLAVEFNIAVDSPHHVHKGQITPGDADSGRGARIPLKNATDLYPNGDNVQTVEPWSPPATWDGLDSELLNRALTDIDAGLGDGNFYTAAPNATDRAAWRVVQRYALGKSEGQCREVIRTWVKTGLLVEFSYENPATRKPVKGLKVDCTKRPG
jgi:hypothetical protein